MRFTTAPAPTISGTARVGLTLTAALGKWVPTLEPSYSSYWSADGAPLTRATNSTTLLLTAAEAGTTITFTVVTALPGYERLTRTSAPTSAVATGVSVVKPGSVTIEGIGLVGTTFTVYTGTWTPNPVTFTYQWSVGGKAVPGATGGSYTATAADVGKRVTAAVTGSYPGATPATKIAVFADSVTQYGSISGTVYQPGSPAKPVARGYVTLWPRWAGEYSEPVAFAEITNGAYSFTDVLPDEYTMEFSDSTTGQSAFLGNGNLYSASTAFAVSSGRPATKNFTFSGVGSITGTLTLAGPSATSGTVFQIDALSSSGRGYAQVAADGTFTISGLPVGSYTLTANAYVYPPGPYTSQVYTIGSSTIPARVSVAPGRTVSGISIVMQPAARLAGVVTSGPSGLPIAGASVQLYSLGANGGFFGSTESGAGGQFTLQGIPAGSYKVFVRPPSASGLASTWIGGADADSATTFTVKSGYVRTGLSAVLPAEAVLTGVVVTQDTGLPIRSDYILYPTAPSLGAASERYGTTDAQGRLSVSGLPAGQYTIQVHPLSGDYPDQVWGQGLPGGTRYITLTAGQTTDIRVVALKQY